MKRLTASTLALVLAATSAGASAQSYGGYRAPEPDRYGQGRNAQYDYARVIRVDPVYTGIRTASGYGTQCRETRTYAGYGGGYRDDGYYGDRNDGDSRNEGYYRNDGYARGDGYYGGDAYGQRGGTQAGATVATVVGGVIGAVIGSQVGGGSARYATSAIGSMVGGVAGRQVYDNAHRQQAGAGTVRVCDPVPVNDRYGYGDRAVNAYDVTYEYAGRRYTSRMDYNPGDRIRVRVDVRPE